MVTLHMFKHCTSSSFLNDLTVYFVRSVLLLIRLKHMRDQKLVLQRQLVLTWKRVESLDLENEPTKLY